MTPDSDRDDEPTTVIDAADYDDVVAALAEPHAEPPPPHLRASVLQAARSARQPGITMGEAGVVATAAECYRTLVDQLYGVARALGPASWDRQARPYAWTCHELLGHLLAVERYTASLVGGEPFDVPAGTETDHLAFGEPTIAVERHRSPEATVADWHAAAAALADRASAMAGAELDEIVSFNGVPMRVATLWKARSFELWAHADDLCLAAGLPRLTPPAPVLRAMSTTSIESLPLVLALLGRDVVPAHARIVLTGDGGGAFSVLVGGGSAEQEPSTTIVVDVVDYCRMAARRLDRTAMHGRVHGDGRLAEQLFDAAQALAV
jgi:uncharacterized protein (TIGR03083 family)